MPNINFELNLNKHPKDVPNRALVSANNIQLSGDLSCLQSEFCITENVGLKEIINDNYVAGYIPCNKEFILFIAPKTWNDDLVNNKTGISIDIWRFREQGNLKENNKWKDIRHRGSFDLSEGKKIYKNFIWNGGKIKGTFTYNIKSQLILAIAESNTLTGENIPLKSINVGSWDDVEYNKETDIITIINNDNDLELTNDKLSLNPEIKIPSITDFDYVNGSAYKGWYYLFIRYKINNIDYTKWYSVGYPILIDELEKVTLFNYFIKSNKYSTNPSLAVHEQKRVGQGVIDYISSGSNTCNKTINLTIDHKNNSFSYYQIGIVCCTKDNQRAFKSLDLIVDNINSFLLNFNSLEEYNVNDLIFEKYNYYDVKNVINYKNRLYLSNYKENNIDDDKLQKLKNKITFDITREEFNYKENRPYENINIGFNWYLYTIQSQSNIFVLNSNASEINIPINQNFSNFIINDSINDYRFVLKYDKYIDEQTILYKQHGIANIPLDSLKTVGTINVSESSEIQFSENIKLNITPSINIIISSVTAGTGGLYNITGRIEGTINIVKQQVELNTTPLDNYHNRLKNTTLLPGESYTFYVHFVNKYGEFTEGIKIMPNTNRYISKANNGTITIVNDKYVDIEKTIYKYYLQLNIGDISDSEYIGFFISYEKFQKTKQFTGILTRYDFAYNIDRDTDGYYFPMDDNSSQGKADVHKFTYYIENSNIPDKENKYKFRFYCTDIDTQDTIQLDFIKLIVEGRPSSKVYVSEYNNDEDFTHDNSGNMNGDKYILNGEYKVLNATYVSAHNFSKNNDYRGSYIELELENAEQLINTLQIENTFYKASLIANNDNLYLSENKILHKFTNVYYFDEELNNILINKGLPGYTTFNTALIYNNNKVILNAGYNILVDKEYYSYIISSLFNKDNSSDKHTTSLIRYPFVAYYTYIDYNNYPFESRKFKTLPEIISIRDEGIRDDIAQSIFTFTNATIVQPMNSIDLFENKIGSQDNVAIKTYINFISENINVFNKRIVRSNPISDESFENSWRTISPEAYKDITENKGNITNIIALGTTLLVHTEHSLFMFDRDNTLQNGEGNTVQLAMPDIFDVDYKEILASELGSCGLQDSDAWILDEFGYVFYDNDAHKFYKFGSKQIENINNSITQFIDKYKPYRVRFANDSESNRILVNILYRYDNDKIDEKTLSYNYIINKWISFHSYCFDRAFHTKQMVYLIVDKNNINKEIYSKMYVINRQKNDVQNEDVIKNLIYNKFENIRNLNSKSDYYYSDISIMVNDKYELIKTLEFITWKLYKIKMKDIADTNYNDFPREELKVPYSGYKLQVFNDNIDTGIIDIEVDTENNKNKSVMNYKKPWWQFDNWNLNYFRDIKNAKSQLAKYMSRLYGNYFIIRIWFGDTNGQRCEFETLDCSLINNPTI